MRVNPVTNNYYHKSLIRDKHLKVQQQHVTFEGKHSGAKILGGLFGTIAAAGAIGGSLIMSGGLALPFIIGYGAVGAAGGAMIGHQIDKGAKK